MTNLPEPRLPRSWLSELSDAVNGFNSWANLRPMFADAHLIRLEEETKDGHYLVHAEMPGIDPTKDVDITLCNRELTIKAERSERSESHRRSEFHYGSFVRTVTLPAVPDADDVKATYDKGILTVDVAIPAEAAPQVKHVAVQAG